MKNIVYAVLATAGLLILYFITMTRLNGWAAAIEQFSNLWYLMVPLAASFGIQIGLYTRLNVQEGVFSIYKSERKQNFQRSLPSLTLSPLLDRKTIASSGIRHADQSVGGTESIAAGGASSGVSMLACCAHHTTDVLPFLGLSGVSIFLTQFQKPMLLVSLGINGVGIIALARQTYKLSL